MGPFSTTRNEPWCKNAESCLKITDDNSFFIGSCSLHVDHILLTTPNPFQENNYIVRELRKGFKMEFPWMWVGPISILWDLNFFKNLYLVASTKKFIKKGQTKVKIIIAICESES